MPDPRRMLWFEVRSESEAALLGWLPVTAAFFDHQALPADLSERAMILPRIRPVVGFVARRGFGPIGKLLLRRPTFTYELTLRLEPYVHRDKREAWVFMVNLEEYTRLRDDVAVFLEITDRTWLANARNDWDGPPTPTSSPGEEALD